MFKIIHNIETGEITKIDLVGDELAEFIANEKLGKEAADKEAKEFAEIAKAKDAALAKLAALGLTIDDLAALGL
jgi:hypothetical protein